MNILLPGCNGLEGVPTNAELLAFITTPAQRPLNSRLDTTQLRQSFGLALPAWQRGVERMLAEHR
jgi:dTDP-4-dehydrorhamnose reductase